ncbi:MAG: ABC transporter ATP-binding protein [Planctomycetota bacterium]|jgi:putative ABC transport system ATP-binding protein|nr:ABC transporter ATP-binding protein [Planctomycetota bacterium]
MSDNQEQASSVYKGYWDPESNERHGQYAHGKEVIVRAHDVKKVYKANSESPVHALRGVTMEIYKGEYLAIMGPSGSGKSTFFNAIGGLDRPSSGQVYIDEVDIAQLDAAELAWLRCRKIGYIFQSYNLIPVMTAIENIMLPMTFAGTAGDEARHKAFDLCKLVGIDHRADNKPSELSGGQQQRVAIARSLANDPAIILADEPTANLDSKTGLDIIKLLVELKEQKNVTVISATHDHEMLAISDRVLWIKDGQVDRVELREDLKIQKGTID